MSDDFGGRELLTVGEVGKLLSLSTRTVYRLRDDGDMPDCVRLKGSVRWSRKALDAWIAEGCPKHA